MKAAEAAARYAKTKLARTKGSVEQGLKHADKKLEVTYTVAYIAHAPLEPRAAVAEWENGKLVNRDSDLTDVFSAGAIVSTALDMVKWDAAIDSDKLLSRASREEMWKPTRLNDGRIVSYGFGWRLENYKGHKNIGHGGSTSGFSASSR